MGTCRSDGGGGDAMIATDVTFWAPNGSRVPALLIYDPADPLVVRVTFLTGDQPEWDLSRELLAAAMVRPTGEGGVRVMVGTEGWMVLRLRNGVGEAWLRCRATAVWLFLQDTGRLCPPCPGEESVPHRWCGECPAVEAALDRWLAGVVSL